MTAWLRLFTLMLVVLSPLLIVVCLVLTHEQAP